MGLPHVLISTHQGGQRYALRGRKRRVPSCAVFHRADPLAAPVHVFSGRLAADELLPSDRVLSFGEPLEMFLAHFSAQSPLLREPAMPLPMNLLCFGVIVLAGVAKLFRVIRLCLARAQWLRDCQHVLAYSKKSLCLRAGSRWTFCSSLNCCSLG